ncbi:MAG TPA: hypothetical protein VLG40_04920 [Candidatus Saccharimonas sp.]|nr:hypothetical protein [Candidatus Saccharimonas sp.]
MDTASIVPLITTIKAAIKIADGLKNLDVKNALIAASEALQEQREQNLSLREELLALKTKLGIKESYVLDKSVYWLTDDTIREQPFCPACMAKGLEMPMEPDDRTKPKEYFRCPNKECRNTADPWGNHARSLVAYYNQDLPFNIQ